MHKVVLGEPHAENGGDHQYFAHEHAEVIYTPVADKETALASSQRDKVQQHEDEQEPDVGDTPGNVGFGIAEKPAPDDNEGEQQQQQVGDDKVGYDKIKHG